MIVIVDYKTANIGSILNMLTKAGAAARVASKPKDLEGASKLILPGIGHFDTCAKNIRELGFVEPLLQKVSEQKIPLLGICVGAQLLTRGSEEGNMPGLNLIAAHVKRFTSHSNYKIPHMGWNIVKPTREHSLFFGEPGELNTNWRFYFVHSYYMQCDHASNVLATTEHSKEFACAIGDRNIAGLQFHPEKSHRFGLAMLRNFARHGLAVQETG
jgi:imidazole glycerol-phosphate synthase subunit HisH